MPAVILGLGSVLSGAAEQFDIRFYSPHPDFDSPNYEGLSRDTSYSWISSPRLSRSPALQFTGQGDEIVTIEGRLYPHIFGGLSTVAALRLAGEAGKPMYLVRFYAVQDQVYAGSVVGKFVIRRIKTQDTKIGADGFPHRLDFSIELARYGEDDERKTG